MNKASDALNNRYIFQIRKVKQNIHFLILFPNKINAYVPKTKDNQNHLKKSNDKIIKI